MGIDIATLVGLVMGIDIATLVHPRLFSWGDWLLRKLMSAPFNAFPRPLPRGPLQT